MLQGGHLQSTVRSTRSELSVEGEGVQKRKAKSQSAVPDVTPTLDCQGVQIKGNLHQPAAMGRPQRGNRLRLVFQRGGGTSTVWRLDL